MACCQTNQTKGQTIGRGDEEIEWYDRNQEYELEGDVNRMMMMTMMMRMKMMQTIRCIEIVMYFIT